jgi:hypothetical protein
VDRTGERPIEDTISDILNCEFFIGVSSGLSWLAWGLDVPVFMEEPGFDDLIGEDKNKPPVMKITFTSPEQLQKAEIEIQELLDRNYSGSYFSVSAGEI